MDVVVGRIGRAHGIRGEVSIDLMTDEPERRFAPGSSVVVRPRPATRGARSSAGAVGGTTAADRAAAGPANAAPANAARTAVDRAMTVRSARPHQGRLLVTFDEVPDRTAAEALRGAQVVVDVDESERPDDPEEFYDHQLEGLRVLRAGVEVGVVREVLHLPAQDLLAVVVEGGTEVLVPFVVALVPEIDLAAGVLHVAELPGLLDPEQSETAGPQ